MQVTLVYVHVKEEYIKDFMEASCLNQKASVKEPGNLRFDVLHDSENPTRFVLIEAYESVESAAAHKNTPHYLQWRETVDEWMAEPRHGVKHSIICPAERESW